MNVILGAAGRLERRSYGNPCWALQSDWASESSSPTCKRFLRADREERAADAVPRLGGSEDRGRKSAELSGSSSSASEQNTG